MPGLCPAHLSASRASIMDIHSVPCSKATVWVPFKNKESLRKNTKQNKRKQNQPINQPKKLQKAHKKERQLPVLGVDSAENAIPGMGTILSSSEWGTAKQGSFSNTGGGSISQTNHTIRFSHWETALQSDLLWRWSLLAEGENFFFWNFLYWP